MRTVTIEIAGLLSSLSALGVQKQLARLHGVTKVEVNYVAGSATVTFDESATTLQAIKAKVQECGYHCAGERVPKHVCVAEDPPDEALAAATPVHRHTTHATHAGRDEATTGEHAAPAEQADAMAHEMGHGAGMDMQAMVRDMRNRFWVSLIFSVPIFVYSPMGNLFSPAGAAVRLTP